MWSQSDVSNFGKLLILNILLCKASEATSKPEPEPEPEPVQYGVSGIIPEPEYQGYFPGHYQGYYGQEMAEPEPEYDQRNWAVPEQTGYTINQIDQIVTDPINLRYQWNNYQFMMNQDHSLTSKFIIKLTQGTMNIQSLIKHLTITMTNHPPIIPPHTIQHMELQPIINLQLTKLITDYHTPKIHQNPINHSLHITHLLLITNQPTRLTIKVLILMKIQLQQPMAHLDHLIKALINFINKVQYHMDPIHHKVMDRDQGHMVRDHIKVINPTKLMEVPLNPTAIYQRPTGTWKGLGLITPIFMGYHPLTQFMVENLIKVVGPILTNRIYHLF